MNKAEVLERLLAKGYDIIDTHYFRTKNNIDKIICNRYEKFQNEYDNREPKLMKRLINKTNIKLLNHSEKNKKKC